MLDPLTGAAIAGSVDGYGPELTRPQGRRTLRDAGCGDVWTKTDFKSQGTPEVLELTEEKNMDVCSRIGVMGSPDER